MTSRIVFPVLILFTVAFTSSFIHTRAKPSDKVANAGGIAAQESQVERGRYLVEEVAKCGECHSPRDSSGQLDHSRWLQGAPIWIMPVHPDSSWAERAPAIAGFPSYTDAQGEKILEQGVGPNGLVLRRPMHEYHLKHEDAVAIIAYLKSLPPGVSPQ